MLRDRKPPARSAGGCSRICSSTQRSCRSAKAIQARVDAIVARRLLLDAVDHVKPLLDTLTAALREALQHAREQVEAERDGVGRHPRDR